MAGTKALAVLMWRAHLTPRKFRAVLMPDGVWHSSNPRTAVQINDEWRRFDYPHVIGGGVEAFAQRIGADVVSVQEPPLREGAVN